MDLIQISEEAFNSFVLSDNSKLLSEYNLNISSFIAELVAIAFLDN